VKRRGGFVATYDSNLSAPSGAALYTAFWRAVVAWHQADERTRDELNPHTRNPLDAADAIRELHDLAAYGGAQALDKLARQARAMLARVRKTAQLRAKSDGGVVLVQWAHQGLGDNESSRWIAEKLAGNLSEDIARALALRRHSWGEYRQPTRARIAEATKAIEKHRGSAKSLTERDPDHIARVCVQHALEAFGLNVSKAKTRAGLRQVPSDKRKRA